MQLYDIMTYGILLALTLAIKVVAVTTNAPLWSGSKWRSDRWSDIAILHPDFMSNRPTCTCVDARQCPEFMVALEFRATHSEVLRGVTCGFKGFIPFVCCNQVLITRQVIPSTSEDYPRSHTHIPQSYCNPALQSITTVQPRINSSPSSHSPDMYYHTSRKPEDSLTVNKPEQFLNIPRFRPHQNTFLIPNTMAHNTPNTSPKSMYQNNMPTLSSTFPDYFIKNYDNTRPSYSGVGFSNDQHFPLNSAEHSNTDGLSTKVDYPHRTPWNDVNYPPNTNSDNKHRFEEHLNYNPSATDGHHHHFSNTPGYNQPDKNHPMDKNFPKFPSPTIPHQTQEENIGSQFYPHQSNPNFNYGVPPWFPQQDFWNVAPQEVSHTINPSRSPDTNGPRTSVIGFQEERLLKRKLLPTEECGVSIGERIVGGRNALLGAYPWIARIGYTRSGSDTFLYRCGGSLINNRYVITAAHCVTQLPGGLELATVRLGELDERTDPDCTQIECAEPVQDFLPSVVTVHEGYDNPRFRNDLALIRLDRPVNISSYTSPICLPFDSLSNKTYTGLKSVVAGWGATDLGTTSSSPILQWVTVTVVPTLECAKTFAERTGTQLGPGQMCAGGEKGRDSCEGDSGGPLMRGEQLDPDDFQRYFLLGVVSFGARRCGSESLPGVYSAIPAYLNWILDNIQP